MNQYNRDDIIRIAQEEDVEFIRLQFTDMFGMLKNVAVTYSQLEKILNNECVFDTTNIDGLIKTKEAQMSLHPDLNTFAIFPWRPQQGKVARMFCDLHTMSGEAFEGDPRFVLKRALKEAADMGYTFKVGPKCEFFLFNTDENTLPTTMTHEKAGYFDCGPMDFGENARRDIVLTLEDMGFVIESSHHEKAPAQHEVDFMHDEALASADNIMTFKLAVKMVAKRHGLHATFMPKPKFGVDGSGMHINMTLFKDGKNIFDDPDGELGLSKEAYYFMGGIMKHIKAITAITNPLVNSYKRLVPGFCAPTSVNYSVNSENSLFLIPFDKGENARVELRIPDPSANPYLALAVCLMAGLKGIKEKQEPPKASAKNREKILPTTLKEAISELEKDTFIKDVLGKELCKKYMELKMAEWQDYTSQVTEWEINQYLDQYSMNEIQ